MAAGLMAYIRLTVRLCAILCLVPASLVLAIFLAGADAVAPRLRRQAQPAMMRYWFRLLARIWGLDIETRGTPVPAPVLVACNHRSWLDIVVLGATLSGTFISKAEIDRWPLVGYLARHGGRTLYISRGEMRSFKALGGNLIGRLREGDRVIFFPEGGVSGERTLLRFRPRLFEAAIAARCPVQPAALAYVGGDGAVLAPMMQGDKFPFHALRMLCCRCTGVRLEFLAPLATAGANAKALAAEAQAAVATVLAPPEPSDAAAFADTLV
ncbi:MAG: lysophospholipid acyltransferase family protein [Gammaproteobacteria bacterium]